METFDGGAGADVMKLEQGLPEPEDFDAFWAEQIGLLDQVRPEVISMVEVDAGTPGYVACDVKIQCAGPTPVSGILTMPVGAKAGSLKAQMTFNGYGYARTPTIRNSSRRTTSTVGTRPRTKIPKPAISSIWICGTFRARVGC